MVSGANSPVILSANRLTNRPKRRDNVAQPIEDDQYYNADKVDRVEKGNQQMIKPTFKRYIILFLFCVNAFNKSFQWAQIPASTEKLSYYYGVETYVINSIAVVFMLSFVVISIPACHAIELIGLRWAVLSGAFAAAVGSVIKFSGYTENGIYLLCAGQILVSLGEQLIFSVPARLTSVWFPDHQVSTALSLTVFGHATGVAFGFMIPQRLLDGADTKALIELGLYKLFKGTAVLSVVAFILDFLLFDEAPKYAPGTARERQIREEKANRSANPRQGFLREMGLLWRLAGALMSDTHVCLLVFSYGVNMGMAWTLETVLNQILEEIRPGDDVLIGNTGFIYVLVGALSLPIIGRVMDKLHRYKMINVMLTILSLLSLVFFTYAIVILQSTWSIYLSSALAGFFQTALVPAGMEFAIELTYPAPELVTSSVMNVMPNLIGTVMVYVSSYLVENFGLIAVNVFFMASVCVALVLLLCTRERLNRQNAVVQKPVSDTDANSRY